MSRTKRDEHETFVLRFGHAHPWESWGRARFRMFQRFYISFSPFLGMQLQSATFASIICPLRVTRVAAPSRALHGHRQAEECAHVGDGAVELLEVHIQRLAFRAARLLVESDALHV